MQGSITAAFALIAGLATANTGAFPINADGYGYETSDLCGIYLDEGPDGTYLAAYAAEGTEGEYIFSLRQGGPDGTSQITQSGEFAAFDGEDALLSEMTLDLYGTYEASLQTYSWDGEFLCRVIV